MKHATRRVDLGGWTSLLSLKIQSLSVNAGRIGIPLSKKKKPPSGSFFFPEGQKQTCPRPAELQGHPTTPASQTAQRPPSHVHGVQSNSHRTGDQGIHPRAAAFKPDSIEQRDTCRPFTKLNALFRPVRKLLARNALGDVVRIWRNRCPEEIPFKQGDFVEFLRAEYPAVFLDVAVAVARELLVHVGERQHSFGKVREGQAWIVVLEFLEGVKLIFADDLQRRFRETVAGRP